MTPSTSNTVHFRTSDGAHADRIEAVLEALGYDVTRESADDAPDPFAASIAHAVKHFKFTLREAELIDLIVRYGSTHEQLAAKLGVSRSTIKWHSHNIFAKTLTDSREALLRCVLGLSAPQAPPTPIPLNCLTAADAGRTFTLVTPKGTKCPDRVYLGRDDVDGSHSFQDGPSKQTIYHAEDWAVLA